MYHHKITYKTLNAFPILLAPIYFGVCEKPQVSGYNDMGCLSKYLAKVMQRANGILLTKQPNVFTSHPSGFVMIFAKPLCS